MDESGVKILQSEVVRPKVEVIGYPGAILSVDGEKLAGVIGEVYPKIGEVLVRLSPDDFDLGTTAVAVGDGFTVFEGQMVGACKRIYERFLGNPGDSRFNLGRVAQTITDEHFWARKFVKPDKVDQLLGKEWLKEQPEAKGGWNLSLAMEQVKRYAAMVMAHELDHVDRQKDFLILFGWAVGAVAFMALGVGILEMEGRDVWKELSNAEQVNYFTALVLCAMDTVGIVAGSFAAKVADEAAAYRAEVINFGRLMECVKVDKDKLLKRVKI